MSGLLDIGRIWISYNKRDDQQAYSSLGYLLKSGGEGEERGFMLTAR